MRSYRVVILATVAYTAIGYIVSISVALFLCFPIWKNWYVSALHLGRLQTKRSYIAGTLPRAFACGNPMSFGKWGGRSISLPMSSVCFPMELSSVQSNRNCSVFLLPFPILHKLQVRRAVRIGAYCTFGLGVINIAVCLARFLVIHLAFTNRPPSITVTSKLCMLETIITRSIRRQNSSMTTHANIVSRSLGQPGFEYCRVNRLLTVASSVSSHNQPGSDLTIAI